MNFSGASKILYDRRTAIDTGVTDPKTARNIIFLGDSITWGYNLNVTETIPYLIQNRIDSSFGFSNVLWGTNASNKDNVSRTISTDDVSIFASFKGGTTGVNRHIIGSGNIKTAAFGGDSFTSTGPTPGTGYSTVYNQWYGSAWPWPFQSGNPSTTPGLTGWNNGAVTLKESIGNGPGRLTFNVYSRLSGDDQYYITVLANGAGRFAIKRIVNGAPVTLGTYSVGAKTVTRIYQHRGYVESPDSFGIISSEYQEIDSIPDNSQMYRPSFPLIQFKWSEVMYGGYTPGAMRYGGETPDYTPTSYNNTDHLTYFMNPDPKKIVCGPFFTPAQNGYDFYTEQEHYIENVSDVPTIVGIQVSKANPIGRPLVQVHARNYYSLRDFSGTGYESGNIKSILNIATLPNVSIGSTPSLPNISSIGPIIVIALGTFDIVDSSRQISPTEYITRISTIVDILLNYNNYPNTLHRIILTIPPLRASASINYPFNLYRKAIMQYVRDCNTSSYIYKKISYIDLSRVKMEDTDYQSDNIHPTASGARKLANHYINMLSL